MKKKLSELSEEDQQRAKIAKDDVAKYGSLEAVANSDGGKVIIAGLRDDAASALYNITTKFKTAPELELRTWCGVLAERLALLRTFKNAPSNRKGAMDALDELLNPKES